MTNVLYFRNCWPVTDKKEEQQFRKVCIAWLTDIAEVCFYYV